MRFIKKVFSVSAPGRSRFAAPVDSWHFHAFLSVLEFASFSENQGGCFPWSLEGGGGERGGKVGWTTARRHFQVGLGSRETGELCLFCPLPPSHPAARHPPLVA